MAMQHHLHDSLPDKITPPSSFITTLLAPPPTNSKPTKLVLKVLHVFRQLRDGRSISESESDWHTYKIQREEYEDLICLVKKEESLWGFVQDKIRLDYDSSRKALILRMPSCVHEVFLARVVKEIQSRLHVFTNTEGHSKAFTQKVEHVGSPGLILRHDSQAIIRREPDAMFQHRNAQWPGVIVEVAYTQKSKDLPHLAHDYILETNGSVGVVIGLNIDYKTKTGSISVWRPGYVKDKKGDLELEATQTLNNQVFRDESGSPNLSPDAGLRLELKDFAPDDLAKGISGSFFIESALLCQFLSEAEQLEQETKQRRGAVQRLRPGAKKRRRERTPPEEISSDES